MSDNIFAIEKAAVALRTRYSEDPRILRTDFFCAYPSARHRWIVLVLERAGVPLVLRRFLRGIYNDSTTSVEHAGATRGQFAMMRGVRQGCPVSGFLFAVAVAPVCRWLMSAVLPPDPHQPCFLRRCACAHADDFTLATASLRDFLPSVADAFTKIDADGCECKEFCMCNSFVTRNEETHNQEPTKCMILLQARIDTDKSSQYDE